MTTKSKKCLNRKGSKQPIPSSRFASKPLRKQDQMSLPIDPDSEDYYTTSEDDLEEGFEELEDEEVCDTKIPYESSGYSSLLQARPKSARMRGIHVLLPPRPGFYDPALDGSEISSLMMNHPSDLPLLDEEREKLFALMADSDAKCFYDSSKYEHLPVNLEIKELFQYIGLYTPENIELDTRWEHFIPPFMPSVGDIDAFLKVPRPDGEKETLGFTVVDEPSCKQSDPVVLNLQLRSVFKQTAAHGLEVRSVDAKKKIKDVELWMQDIAELHRSKPPANVHYTKAMPDIETLMQEWPPDFEKLLQEVQHFPSSMLNCSLDDYVRIICALLDIPIYKSKIQSLHVLFTLYSEFKNSHHFRNLALPTSHLEGTSEDSQAKTADRLVISS